MAGKPQNLQNMKFDKLTALKIVGYSKCGSAIWLCQCACGNFIKITASALKNDRPHSCPHCKNVAFWSKKQTHHESTSRLYEIYYNMKKRCENENAINYHNYGGRGIKVCEEWKEYLPFSQWAKANGYSDNLTLDRIDNNGNYCPENCRWVTYKEQANNTRVNRVICFNDQSHTLTEWSVITGIKKTTIHQRLKRGWSVEKALTQEPKKEVMTYQ